LQEEQILGQWFDVTLTIWVDLLSAGKTDQLTDTVDYRQAIALVKQLVSQEKFALVERLTQAIADAVLTLNGVQKVRVQLTKVAPPIPDFGGQIVIDITRDRSAGQPD
jgi:dihydroneopterin aldolase